MTIRRQAKGITGISAQLLGASDFPADVFRIPFVHDIAERGEIIFSLFAVYAIVDGDKTNVMIREKSIGIIAYLQIVPAEPRHIFYNNRSNITGLDVLNHFLKAGTVERSPSLSMPKSEGLEPNYFFIFQQCL